MNILLQIIFISASIALHEWAHVFAVRFLGGKIEQVGVFPLGMMAKVQRLERLHGWERYVIFAAGSAANFAVAIWAGSTSFISYVGVARLDELAFYNFVLGLFNLTPALPLDGGRIALQFLGNSIGILRANRVIVRIGKGVAWAFIALGLVQAVLFPFNISLLCAGIYIRKKNKSMGGELHAAFHIAMDGKNSSARARTLPTKEISIPAKTTVKHAFERIAGDYFIIFNAGGKKLHEKELLAHIFRNGITGTLDEIIL